MSGTCWSVICTEGRGETSPPFPSQFDPTFAGSSFNALNHLFVLAPSLLLPLSVWPLDDLFSCFPLSGSQALALSPTLHTSSSELHLSSVTSCSWVGMLVPLFFFFLNHCPSNSNCQSPAGTMVSCLAPTPSYGHRVLRGALYNGRVEKSPD